MSSTKNILHDIEGGDFQGASEKVSKLKSLKRNTHYSNFYYILHCLNKRLNLKKCSNGDVKYVFCLVDTCCSVLFSPENPKILDTLCLVVQVHQYLLSVDLLLAQKISLYYLKLKNEALTFKVGIKIRDIIYSLIVQYSNLMLKFPSEKLVGDDEKFAVYWIKHILKFFELNHYEKLSKLFRVLSSLLLTASKEKKFYTSFAFCSYNLLIDLFAKMKIKVKTSDDDCATFLQYLGISVFNRSDPATPELLDLLIKCVDGFTSVTDNSYESFPLIKAFLHFYHYGNKSMISFENLKRLSELKYSARSQAAVSIICSLLKNNCDSFKEKVIFHRKLSDSVKILLSLARITQIEAYRRLSSDAATLFKTIFCLLENNQDIEVLRVLTDSFSLISDLFSSYLIISPNDVSPVHVNNTLCFMCKLIKLYLDRKLFLECGELASIIIKRFNKQTVALDNYKVELTVNYILKYLVLSFGEIGRGVQVQMMIINLAIVHPELSEKVFSFWAQLKSMESSKVEKELTVIDFVQKYGEIMEREFDYQISTVDMEYFFMLEVKCYAFYKDVSKEAVGSAASAILKINNRTYFTLSLVHCVDIFTSRLPLPDTSKFEALLHKSLQHNLKILKHKKCCETNLLLGCLYYQLFRCELLHIQKKNEGELIDLDVKVVKPQVLYADQDNYLDDTSFTPAYTYLQYEAHVPLLEKLEAAYKLWDSALKIFEMNDKIMDSIMRQMEALALSYRLYKYNEKERSAWALIMEFGRKMRSFEFEVLGCAQLLLFSSDMDSVEVKEIRTKLESNKDIVSPTVRNLFFLNLAKNAYHKNKIEESINILKCFEPKAGISFLVTWEHAIFSKMCNPSDRSEDIITTIKKIYSQFLSVMKNRLFGSYVELCGYQCALLDTAILLAKLHLKEKNFRHSLYYCKAQLEIAQRLAMPIRVSEFLTELGYTDMAVWKSSECDMKLKVVSTILEYDEIRSQIKETYLTGSPNLSSKVRVLPHFLKSSCCSCICCTNVDYQALTLNVITLNILNSYSKSANDATEGLIQTGFKVIQYLENVSSHVQFREYLVRFYNVVSDIYCFEGNYDEALLYNSKAINVIDGGKSNIYIDSRDVFRLKNQIIWKKNYKRKPRKKENRRYQESALSLKLQGLGISTPVVRVKIPPLCFIDSPEDTKKPKQLKKRKNLPSRKKKKRIEDSDDEFEFIGKTNKVFNLSNLFDDTEVSIFSWEEYKKENRTIKFSDLFGKEEDQGGFLNQNLPRKMSNLTLNDEKCSVGKEPSQILNEIGEKSRKPEIAAKPNNEMSDTAGKIQISVSSPDSMFTRRVRRKLSVDVFEISSSDETPVRPNCAREAVVKKSPKLSEFDSDISIIDETPPEKTKSSKLNHSKPLHDNKNSSKNSKLDKQPMETPTGRITRSARMQLRM